MYKFFMGVTLFIIYSFLGWLMEVIVCFPESKKFVNRGFLIGPVCPIYGCGCLLIVLLLNKYKEDVFTLFCMSVIICSLLEYFTSYVMEKIFKTRWWDYSDKKFNLNGRICLTNMFYFGLLGLLMIYIVNPFLVNILSMINHKLLIVVASILLVILILDYIVSTKIISNIKGIGSNLLKDSTEEINAKVKEVLMNKGIFSRRVVNAFPNFKVRESLLKKRMEYMERKANKKKKVKE